MSGDLSITAQPPGRDLAAGAGGARLPVTRSTTPDRVVVAPVAASQAAAADARQPLEAAHLRTLLTDPAMRISTHHDDASGRTILQVQNHATGEVIEQIPSEALLRLYAAMRDSLVDERA